MGSSAAKVGVLTAVALLFAAACSSTDPCDPARCAGCCDPGTGECVIVTSALHCGLGGACVACAASQVCVGGTCSFPAGGGGGSGGGGGGGSSGLCAGTTIDCSGTCKDIQSDLSNCQACGLSCGAGEVCSKTGCKVLPGDCVAAGSCAPGYSCDPQTKACTAGCRAATDCPQGGQCNGGTCACPTGQVACGQICLPSNSVSSCGATCRACVTPTHGVATCNGTACGATCDPGYAYCGGLCVPCSTPANASPSCAGSTCDFACNNGYHRCGDQCLSTTSPSSCGTSCSPCPAVSHGVATCVSAACGVQCNANYEAVGPQCEPQSTWVKQNPAHSVGGGDAVHLVWDVQRGVGVLYRYGQIFTWDGTDWTYRSSVGTSSSRVEMAYDSARGRVVIFSGENPVTSAGGTWEWDGTTWTKRTTATLPPERYTFAMAYDSARGRVVLFGGRASSNAAYLNDTWEWDGTVWTQRTPATSPPGREGHAMAYDAQRGRTVLFGGVGSSVNLHDTWEWDGTTWTNRTPNLSPAQHYFSKLTYDSKRHRVVLFGGEANNVDYATTFDWDGTSWLKRSPTVSPPGRVSHALAYDPVHDRVLLVGGWSSASNGIDDTWLLSTP